MITRADYLSAIKDIGARIRVTDFSLEEMIGIFHNFTVVFGV
jgi:hypothetical protein